MKISNPLFFPVVDVFRGIAVLLVFLFHFWTFHSDALSPIFSVLGVGHIGVDLFFVLSGFLVTLSLWKSESFSSYYMKRIRRIVPLAFLSLFLFWGITTDFSWNSFLDLGLHLLFLHGFFPEWYHSINPVMWSLSVEMLFYLLLPVVWIVLSKKKLRTFLFIFFGLVVISFLYRAGLFFLFESGEWNISWEEKLIFSEQLWGRMDQFFLGILLACIMKNQNLQSRLFPWRQCFLWKGAILLLISGGVFLFLGSEFRSIFSAQVFLHFLTGAGFTFLILFFLLRSPSSLKKRSIYIMFFSQCFRWLGILSYGIYLFHFPVLSVVSSQVSNPLFSLVLCLGITVGISWVSWKYFEQYFYRTLGKK